MKKDSAAALDGIYKSLFAPRPTHSADALLRTTYMPDWMNEVRIEQGMLLVPDQRPDIWVTGPLGRVSVPYAALLLESHRSLAKRLFRAAYAVGCYDRGSVRVLSPPKRVAAPHSSDE